MQGRSGNIDGEHPSCFDELTLGRACTTILKQVAVAVPGEMDRNRMEEATATALTYLTK